MQDAVVIIQKRNTQILELPRAVRSRLPLSKVVGFGQSWATRINLISAQPDDGPLREVRVSCQAAGVRHRAAGAATVRQQTIAEMSVETHRSVCSTYICPIRMSNRGHVKDQSRPPGMRSRSGLGAEPERSRSGAGAEPERSRSGAGAEPEPEPPYLASKTEPEPPETFYSEPRSRGNGHDSST